MQFIAVDCVSLIVTLVDGSISILIFCAKPAKKMQAFFLVVYIAMWGGMSLAVIPSARRLSYRAAALIKPRFKLPSSFAQ